MYRRTTRETTLASLPRPIAEALSTHASSHQIELGGVRCWVTHSENPPADGFFGKLLGRRANPVDPDAEHDTVLVLHPTHVLVATSGARRGTSVLSLPLAQASLTRGSAIAARMGVAGPNDGFTLSGFPGDEGRPGTYFVGLGSGPSGEECARAVEDAIRVRKNPR